MRKTRKGVHYWTEYAEALHARDDAKRAFSTARLVPFQPDPVRLIWAVQLHQSGPYLGPELDAAGGAAVHVCDWCPMARKEAQDAQKARD